MKTTISLLLTLPLLATAQTVDVRDFVFNEVAQSWNYSGTFTSSTGDSGTLTSINENVGLSPVFDGPVGTRVTTTLNTSFGSGTGELVQIVDGDGYTVVEITPSGSTFSKSYTPYLLQLPGTMTVGQTTNRNGEVDAFPNSGTYDASVTIEAVETITVPAGTFEALRVRVNTTEAIEVTFQGTTTTRTTAIRWYARGIGLIKEENTTTIEGGENPGSSTTVTELTLTTRPLLNLPVDGPPPLLGQAVATGGGWYFSPWLDAVNVIPAYGWYYQQGLGAIYSGATNPAGPIWIYIPDLGWIYTTAEDFPSMYSVERGSWIIWIESTDPSVRTFFDFTTQEFFTI